MTQTWAVEVERQIEIGHQLDDTQWLLTKECNRAHGHGYRVKVKAEFESLLPNGMACDFAVIKNCINKYDHQNLNDFFSPTTAETFAEILHYEISKALTKYGATAKNITVSLSETGKSWVTYSV